MIAIVLAIDDAPAWLNVLRRIFRAADAQLLVAADFAQAAEIIRSGIKIDCVLLDLGLPDTAGGINTVRKIQNVLNETPGDNAPIVVLSGEQMTDEFKATLYALGVREVLEKSASSPIIVTAVQDAIKSRPIRKRSLSPMPGLSDAAVVGLFSEMREIIDGALDPICKRLEQGDQRFAKIEAAIKANRMTPKKVLSFLTGDTLRLVVVIWILARYGLPGLDAAHKVIEPLGAPAMSAQQ